MCIFIYQFMGIRLNRYEDLLFSPLILYQWYRERICIVLPFIRKS